MALYWPHARPKLHKMMLLQNLCSKYVKLFSIVLYCLASRPSHTLFPLLKGRAPPHLQAHTCLPDLPRLGQVPPLITPQSSLTTDPMSELNEKPKNKSTGEQMNE